MAEESHKARSRKPPNPTLSLIVAWVVGAVGVAYLLWVSAAGPLPHPPLHDAVTTALGVGAVLACVWHIAERSAAHRQEDAEDAEARHRRDHNQMLLDIKTLIVETNIHHARALAGIHRTVVNEMEQRSDIPTDRIVAIVAQGTASLRGELAHLHDAVDARFSVIETAVSDHVCKGYADGYADGLLKMPLNDDRRHLKSINGTRPS